jgi:hypothetical protein
MGSKIVVDPGNGGQWESFIYQSARGFMSSNSVFSLQLYISPFSLAVECKGTYFRP